jgi:hypothetical protein
MQEKKAIKNWDNVTVIMLVFAVAIIIFSFLSPLVFTLNASDEKYNFTQTGAIGDTIGGLTSPFIGLTGILLTFLAFYMQIKANQIQIKQFNDGITKENERVEAAEKLDCYVKLKLLKVDLEAIKKDIIEKSKKIFSYYTEEIKYPFESHLLYRTPSKKYVRILEIDRLSIFRGFEIFLNNRTTWIEDFSMLYNILDFLPEFFADIYNKHEYHSKDLFDSKMAVRSDLIKLMNELANILSLYMAEKPHEDYLSYPASALAHETIGRYYKIIDESFDENKNPIKETDFVKLKNEVLGFLIDEILKQRKNYAEYDVRLGQIVERSSDLIKEIHLIEQRALEFSLNIESQYNNLMIDMGDTKSYFTIIDKIYSIIDIELSKHKI